MMCSELLYASNATGDIWLSGKSMACPILVQSRDLPLVQLIEIREMIEEMTIGQVYATISNLISFPNDYFLMPREELLESQESAYKEWMDA